MNLWRRHAVLMSMCSTAALVMTGACSERGERLNAPPQGSSDRRAELRQHFDYMVDKGMLYDSSIADIHFEPHLASLSGTGVRRLTRMLELMEMQGGEIRYQSSLDDADLTQRRLDTVRSFITSSGYDATQFQVAMGLSRGRGMPATRAILGMQQVTTTALQSGAVGGPAATTASPVQ